MGARWAGREPGASGQERHAGTLGTPSMEVPSTAQTCWELVGLQEDRGDLARWAASELIMVLDPTRAEPS